MKRPIFILSVILIFFGCTKKESTRTSGTDTIDNTTYISTTYYYYGFSFSEGKLVSTTLNPGPDITLYVNVDNPATPRLTLVANNLNPSFLKIGNYATEADAQAAFDNLKTVTGSQWTDMADPVINNQVWVYKSQTGNYTKFRIVSTVNETRNSTAYGECKFQWQYQPDGTTTFP